MSAAHLARAQVPSGLATLTIGPIGAECRGGCTVAVAFAVARPAGAKAAAPLPPVPVSLLFDPLAPCTPLATAGIDVPEVGGGAARWSSVLGPARMRHFVWRNLCCLPLLPAVTAAMALRPRLQAVALAVNVSVAAPGGKATAGGTPVVAPNATADISVKVADAQGNPLPGAQVRAGVVGTVAGFPHAPPCGSLPGSLRSTAPSWSAFTTCAPGDCGGGGQCHPGPQALRTRGEMRAPTL